MIFAFALAFVPCASAQQTTTVGAGGGSGAKANSSAGGGTITVRVLGEDNQPVPNALVTANQLGAFSRFTHDNSGAATGRYLLTNLDAGVYQVSASAPGYVEESDPSPDPAARNLYRPGDTVTLRLRKGGVVTGRVTDAAGEPLVGVRVRAVRVRDAQGRPARETGFGSRDRRTDDRGVYRLYGLPAGTYVVLAGGRAQFGFTRLSAFDVDVPTYYPSATRDTAVEVQVQAGQEVTDIDIRYRGELGHTVSGTVAGRPGGTGGPSSAVTVSLVNAATGLNEGFTVVSGSSETSSFNFDGVADGDYEARATTTGSFLERDAGLASEPVRVSVRGADVTGLRLALAPLAVVTGRLAFEPLKPADAARPECKNQRAFVPQEVLVSARRDDPAAQQRPPGLFPQPADAAATATGEFTLRNLTAGRYRPAARLYDDSLFLRSATLPQPPAAAAPAANQAARTTPAAAATDAARSGFVLRSGDRLTGLTVTVAAGAASLRGRVTPAEGETLPDNLRVHLVPAERERAEETLRYAETAAQPDGTFDFKNLAPGRYLLVARAQPDADARTQASAAAPRPLAWDAQARADLRREAEAAKNAVELQPCQRAEDIPLRFKSNDER